MYKTKVKSEFLILDFDIENRPLSYMGRDYTTAEITVIACKFINAPNDLVHVWALGKDSPEEMLQGFLDCYNQAGMVVGHYIRGHDLPMINMSLNEYNLGKLENKLVHDTYGDLIKQTGYSKSQENLAELYGIEKPKVGLSQLKWRDANRLTKKGIERAVERCAGDVLQNIDLREELIKRGQLGKPKIWSSTTLR